VSVKSSAKRRGRPAGARTRVQPQADRAYGLSVPQRVFRVAEAAAYLRCTVSLLNKLRVTGGGPVFVKAGIILYRLEDLDAFLLSRRRASTSGALPPDGEAAAS